MSALSSAPSLEGRRVLVAEDEWFLAVEMEDVLRGLQATVVGPVPSVAEALRLIEAGPRPDVALLDVNLGGEMVYPMADRLLAEGVPVILTTGYAERDLPARYAHLPRLEKPVEVAQMVREVRQALGQAAER